MEPVNFGSESLPGIDTSLLKGMLIALEGVEPTLGPRLVAWLEGEGYVAVRSAPEPMGSLLLRCAELAERLELEIVPALRAGFIVIADDYVQALRGDDKWAAKVTGFALIPHLTLAGPVTFEDAQRRIAEIRGVPLRPSAGRKRRSVSPSSQS